MPGNRSSLPHNTLRTVINVPVCFSQMLLTSKTHLETATSKDNNSQSDTDRHSH
jgi:hypothetical protein